MTRSRPRLLLYLASAEHPTRLAVAPALAAAADRAGWTFDCYYDALRAGRHFGGPTPESVPPGWAGGTPVAGGRHLEKLAWIAARYEVFVVGDPGSTLLPALADAGPTMLALTREPARVYEAAFEALGAPIPAKLVVLDGRPQGSGALVVAPYLYPAFFAGPPALGTDVSADEQSVGALEALGIDQVDGLFVDADRARRFPRDLVPGPVPETYAELTATLADRWSSWGRGLLLGDPDLVAAQLPKGARLRLLPVYGRPQADVLRLVHERIAAASEPVYGRQDDDEDFFTLSRSGRSLQVLDPSPPFDAAATLPEPVPPPPGDVILDSPSDDELVRWADDGRVLVTLLFWAGMIREVDCYAPLFDLVAETGLRAGVVLTAESLEHGGGAPLSLLSAPRTRGGVFGLLEPLLGSTGRGVAAESLLAPAALSGALSEALDTCGRLLPPDLVPRGWWPLLDTPLSPYRQPPVALRAGVPTVLVRPDRTPPDGDEPGAVTRRTLRRTAGAGLRRAKLDRFVGERRPFDDVRPGGVDRAVADAARAAGLEYMWTKADFGRCRPHVVDHFVALPFTAGAWDGWSPFYTISRAPQLRTAERRLLRRRRPGWVASTIDTPLWLLPGELRERGARLHEIASLASRGGSTGELLNVTPNVVARYARLLAARGQGDA